MDDQSAPRTSACANCSRRKTKCDRNNPCSSCTSAKLSCVYTSKKPEKKSRISLSARYETSLTDISNQLDELSSSLNYLVERVDALNVASRATPSLNGSQRNLVIGHAREQISQDTSLHSNHPTTDHAYSTASHSQSTTEVANSAAATPEDAIGIVETLTAHSKVQESLTQEDTLNQSTSSSFSEYPELTGVSLPSMDLALRLLTLSKTTKQQYFVEFPHMPQDVFAELCQKVYFPTQSFTIFSWLNVNCGLFYLFRDLDPSAQFTGAEVAEGMAICARNVDAAVRCLRLYVASTFEAAQALLCAALVVMEGERGSVSWLLLSTAARMSTDIGLHRLPPGKEKSQQRMLFWHIYALERSLAFSFGRCATIQDHDVRTTLPSAEEDFQSNWGFRFVEYIGFARLQYDVHENLLSARAQQEDNATRSRKTHDMAARLLQIQADFVHSRPNEDHTVIIVGIASMLTAVYRTLPPDDPATEHPLRFHPLCIESGRLSLSSLLHVWRAIKQFEGKESAKPAAKLPLLFIPYIPYVAVFGNQIATGDQEDLQLMRDIVGILQTVSETTVATRKMYNGFLRLLRIAEAWPRATAPSVDGAAPALEDIDMTELNWQDLGFSDHMWSQAFNDFDFGPGSEAIRNIMPWFDQQFGESNTGE